MRNKNNNGSDRVNQTTRASDNIAPVVPTDERTAEAAAAQAEPGDIDNPADETPAQYLPANPQVNNPTVTGFTAEDPGITAPQETDGLRKLTLDEAMTLRGALDQVIGYQTGVTYRHDFTSGLEGLRTFGLTFDVARADADATKVQNEVVAKEVSQAHSED